MGQPPQVQPLQSRRAPTAARTMATAARSLLAALGERQRAAVTAPFDTTDRREWTYLPGPRPGLALEEMTNEQRELALALLDSGLSSRGAGEAREIMALETVLAELEREAGGSAHRRDPLCYWFRVLGDPAGTAPWAWHVGGHHVACHITVVEESIAVTPQFFGANPHVIPTGQQAGERVLSAEEDLARDLLAMLEPAQRDVAIVDPVAPSDIHTRRDPVAEPAVVPRGLRHEDMSGEQQNLLTRLVRHYLDRARPEAAEASWRGVVDAGLSQVTFAWAGSVERGRGHYYAVVGPRFLLEYDNTQNNANHVHTVWRDLDNDWGEDLLAAHYAAHHV